VQDAGELVPLLRPFPADAMRAYPVGPQVSNPRNDGAGCLGPAEAAPHVALARPPGRSPFQAPAVGRRI
jgi:hypothetical protein